jgi:hypothetical protein
MAVSKEITKKVKELRIAMEDLASVVKELEELNVFVGFGHARGAFSAGGLENKSDRIYLTSVALNENLYDWKNEKRINDGTEPQI